MGMSEQMSQRISNRLATDKRKLAASGDDFGSAQGLAAAEPADQSCVIAFAALCRNKCSKHARIFLVGFSGRFEAALDSGNVTQ